LLYLYIMKIVITESQLSVIKYSDLLVEERIKFNIPIPEDIIKIKDIFKKNNYKLFVVGGAVRDAILGKTPKDYDLTTDATPDEVETILNNSGYKTLPTGKAFGVINVFTDNDEYEIATFRSESYSENDKRRPDKVEFTDIETDAKRRDFTINALYYDIDTGEVVDLVGGVEDLKNDVVRTVGNPDDRFNEDRLRILRAIRFAGRFGSDLDSDVDQSLQKNSSLEGISGERIKDEFIKGIKSSKSTIHFLQLINKYNLFDPIFMGLNVSKDFIENKDHILVISRLLKNNDLSTIGKNLNNLKYSVDEIKDITFLINLKNISLDNIIQLKRLQKNTKLSNKQINDFGNLEGINQKILRAFINFNLTVSGDEIMKKMNLKPGKEVGDTINKLELEKFKNSL
jgi:tRNA nucleotidyltransferase (CCA-adding enzyme)